MSDPRTHEPVAWAVMSGDRVYDIYDIEGEALAICLWLEEDDDNDSWVTVPLYANQPQPTLTDAEREAVAAAAAACEGIGFDQLPAALRGLLQRLK
jgi:hypothetical protein